jgi:hypothetical protein
MTSCSETKALHAAAVQGPLFKYHDTTIGVPSMMRSHQFEWVFSQDARTCIKPMVQMPLNDPTML